MNAKCLWVQWMFRKSLCKDAEEAVPGVGIGAAGPRCSLRQGGREAQARGEGEGEKGN